ncbi:MAG: copper homeostasis protein CutC [Culicoidibacterales bacterium]
MIEVIVTTLAELAQATAGCADRVELVAQMQADGLTPSDTTLKAICANAQIPVRVMVRFHNDGFSYTQPEIEQMCAWIAKHIDLPIDGFVIGGICPDGTIDTDLLDAVTRVCGNLPLTFHRAFDDLTPIQQLSALPILKAYPIDTILTSGGRVRPIGDNLSHLAKLAAAAAPIQILLGGGVNAEVVTLLQAYPNLSAIHIGSAAHQANDFAKPIQPERIQALQAQLHEKRGISMNEKRIQLQPAVQTDASTIMSYIYKLAEHEKSTHLVKMDEASLIQTMFVEKAAQAFLVQYQGETVGLVVLSKTFSTYLGKVTLFLEDLYLDEHVRGLGLGRAIFAELQTLVAEKNYGRIEWTCLTSNESSRAFYEKLGATQMDGKILFRL